MEKLYESSAHAAQEILRHFLYYPTNLGLPESKDIEEGDQETDWFEEKSHG